MATVEHIEKARASKKPRKCRVCWREVGVGESYTRIQKRVGRSGQTLIWCKDHAPRTSDLLSGRPAELEGLKEAYEDTVAKIPADAPIRDVGDLVEEALDTLADAIDEMAEDIQDSADNIEDGLGSLTAQAEQLSRTATELEEWASVLRTEGENLDASKGRVALLEDVAIAVQSNPELNLTG